MTGKHLPAMEQSHNTTKSSAFEEERKGLLSDSQEAYNEEDIFSPSPKTSRKGVYVSAIGLIVLMLGAVFGPPLSRGLQSRPIADFDNQKLRSNGTHWFKKTALIVSIDGLRYVGKTPEGARPDSVLSRADYLDRGLTPHLLAISKKGLRAKSMRPIFPVSQIFLTFDTAER